MKIEMRAFILSPFPFFLTKIRKVLEERFLDNGGNEVCNVALSCDNIEMQFPGDGQ
jgi:hypothetical protein